MLQIRALLEQGSLSSDFSSTPTSWDPKLAIKMSMMGKIALIRTITYQEIAVYAQKHPNSK